MPTGNLLLATDLSSRCDRALDRAVALATECQTPLVILHALEQSATVTDAPSWRQPVDPRERAWRRLRRDLQGAEGVDIDVVVERGKPETLILDAIAHHHCSLVIVGMARNETLGRVLLGSVVDNLAGHSPVPLLVVKNRPRGSYHNIVVATDFSDGSLAALETTLALFPSASISLFHAYNVAFEGLIDDRVAARETAAQQALQSCQEFLAKLPDASGGRSITPICEYGDPGELLQDLVETREVDLVVLGTHGRTGLASILLGSVAQRILMRLDTDVLVVRRNTGR